MPKAVSRKQWRLMQAILHGKAKSNSGPRGRPPASVAAKYTDPGKDAPEQHGDDRGGSWTKEHHEKHASKHHKKSKKELSKAFEDFYSGQAVATIVMDNNSRVLLGRHQNGGLAFPGGHVEGSDGSYELALVS